MFGYVLVIGGLLSFGIGWYKREASKMQTETDKTEGSYKYWDQFFSEQDDKKLLQPGKTVMYFKQVSDSPESDNWEFFDLDGQFVSGSDDEAFSLPSTVDIIMNAEYMGSEAEKAFVEMLASYGVSVGRLSYKDEEEMISLFNSI